MTAGILMVPLLTYYALPGVLLTALLLYQLMLMGLYGKTTLSMLLVVAIAVIPIAGLIEQALAIGLAQMLGIGFITGTLVNGLAVALFPPSPGRRPRPVAGGQRSPSQSATGGDHCAPRLASGAEPPDVLHPGGDENRHAGAAGDDAHHENVGERTGAIDATGRAVGAGAVVRS
jgi:hypothetical protein